MRGVQGRGNEKKHLVSVGIEKCTEVDNVWMRDESHDLQFTVLLSGLEKKKGGVRGKGTDLEALVLQDLLDSNILALLWRADDFCLKDDSKGAIADHLAVCVDEVSLVSGLAVGGNNFDDLVWVVDGWVMRSPGCRLQTICRWTTMCICEDRARRRDEICDIRKGTLKPNQKTYERLLHR